MRLAETQAAIHAVMAGEGTGASGARPAYRLAIHRRHYRASLLSALMAKFPATLWLLGSPRFAEAAAEFVRVSPPVTPCIAEYGARFADFIGGLPLGARAPYLAAIAKADWHLGQVSIAIANAPLAIDALAGIEPEHLAEIRLTLQSGLRFMSADWPIDSLIALHLGGDPPEQFALEREPVWLQLRGARGTFSIERLEPAAFAFRHALTEGATLGAAAERGLAVRADFDPGNALAALFASDLVVCVKRKPDGGSS